MMQLNTGAVQLVDLEHYKEAWPSMETDLLSRWIVLGKEISISLNNNRIELGYEGNSSEGNAESHSQGKSGIIAYLLYQNGFYIRPEKPVDISDVSKALMINQHVVYDKMPIGENSMISLAGVEFSLQPLIS
jgi:hypothetical protein